MKHYSYLSLLQKASIWDEKTEDVNHAAFEIRSAERTEW